MRIVVHFGMPKTGSSSIQASLYRNLQDPRFRYVVASGANQNEVMVSLFKGQPKDAHMHRRKGHSEDDVARLRHRYAASLDRELVASAGRTALISAEAISNFNHADLTRLASYLARRSPRVRAVGYIRSPKAFMESAFQQRVKGPSWTFDVGALVPKYKDRFEIFDQVFGRREVDFWKFDPSSFPGGDVVLDFCARLGIAFQPRSAIRVNESLSLPATALLYAYRKFGPGYGSGPAAVRENRLLTEAVARLPGPKVRLHSSLVEPVIAANRSQIAWMEQRLGASLSEDLTLDDDVALRSESDLLTFEPEALAWLAEQLGSEYAERCRGTMGPETVAEWMHLLRLKLAGADARLNRGAVDRRPAVNQTVLAGSEARVMTIRELVGDAKRGNPALEPVPDDIAVELLREVFKQIGRSINRNDRGSVTVEGLGSFSVRTVDRDKKAAGTRVKRTLFDAAGEDVGDMAGTVPDDRLPRIQESNATRYNRYKDVFAAVRRISLAAEPDKILSFGCSNGDEPLSLAELWFPQSRILGVDVHEESLRVATEKTRGVRDRVEIAHSGQAVIDAWAPFDIVFAMSVLCAWPASKKLDDISPLYGFDEFERNVAMLGRALKKDGLLVIWNASFRFTDTTTAGDFAPVPVDGLGESGFVKKFGPDNKALVEQDYPLFIFSKVR